MDEIKIIKSMFKEGKVSRKEAKQLLKSVISSEINDQYYKRNLKEESIKIKVIPEKENKKVEIDLNFSLKFLRLLQELKSEDDDFTFNFNGSDFKIEINDILDLVDKLKKEGKTNDYIEITAEDGTITKIYAYIN